MKAAQTFALNMLGKDQKSLAFTFFRPADVSDGKLSGQSFRKGTTGAPILIDVPGAVECRVVSIVEQGDHHIVVGEVIDAHLSKPPTGRPDSAILEMKDLGESVFYGGLNPIVSSGRYCSNSASAVSTRRSARVGSKSLDSSKQKHVVLADFEANIQSAAGAD